MVTKGQIWQLGTYQDKRRRETQARKDGPGLRDTISRARSFVYEKGFMVNSIAVDRLLKPESLVPTVVRPNILSPCMLTQVWYLSKYHRMPFQTNSYLQAFKCTTSSLLTSSMK
jgi:hypothetical protein